MKKKIMINLKSIWDKFKKEQEQKGEENMNMTRAGVRQRHTPEEYDNMTKSEIVKVLKKEFKDRTFMSKDALRVFGLHVYDRSSAKCQRLYTLINQEIGTNFRKVRKVNGNKYLYAIKDKYSDKNYRPRRAKYIYKPEKRKVPTYLKREKFSDLSVDERLEKIRKLMGDKPFKSVDVIEKLGYGDLSWNNDNRKAVYSTLKDRADSDHHDISIVGKSGKHNIYQFNAEPNKDISTRGKASKDMLERKIKVAETINKFDKPVFLSQIMAGLGIPTKNVSGNKQYGRIASALYSMNEIGEVRSIDTASRHKKYELTSKGRKYLGMEEEQETENENDSLDVNLVMEIAESNMSNSTKKDLLKKIL